MTDQLNRRKKWLHDEIVELITDEVHRCRSNPPIEDYHDPFNPFDGTWTERDFAFVDELCILLQAMSEVTKKAQH